MHVSFSCKVSLYPSAAHWKMFVIGKSVVILLWLFPSMKTIKVFYTLPISPRMLKYLRILEFNNTITIDLKSNAQQ